VPFLETRVASGSEWLICLVRDVALLLALPVIVISLLIVLECCGIWFAIRTLHHAVYTGICIDERCIRNKFLVRYQISLNPFISKELKDLLENLLSITLANSGQ